jgi:DNA primase
VEGNPVSYIEVALTDIEWANRLANEVFSQSLDKLAPPSRTLLSAILAMVQKMAESQDAPLSEVYFTRRMIREHTGWSDWQVRAHIKQLEELEYLHPRVGSKGKEYAYALNCRESSDGSGRCSLHLTPVHEIRRLIAQKDPGSLRGGTASYEGASSYFEGTSRFEKEGLKAGG